MSIGSDFVGAEGCGGKGMPGVDDCSVWWWPTSVIVYGSCDLVVWLVV